jgi:cell wall-associated NlpC family hydrolase
MRFKVMFLLCLALVALGGCASRPTPVDRPPASLPGARTGSAEPVSEVAFMALALVGSPYANGGSSPDIGFDCSGLVAYVYARALRRELPRNTFDLARSGIAVSDPQPGDLLFYNTQRRPFSHVGIYLGESRFVHAPSTGGAVRIEDMRLAYWASRFDGARRVVD